MTSTGNDIIALHAVDGHRTVQERFYTKFITDGELLLYHSAGGHGLSFIQFVWLLWSVKEAAYKFCKRLDPGLLFSPAKIVVTSIDLPLADHSADFAAQLVHTQRSFTCNTCYCCVLQSGLTTLYSRSLVAPGLIHTVAAGANDFRGVWWGIKRIERNTQEEQSRQVRLFVLALLTEVSGCANLAIEKDADGCPFVYKEGQKTEIAVSLAHHNYYVAYSVALSN